MRWEKPSFVEIDMSAEIGAYQDDFGDRKDHSPVARDGAVERDER